MEINLRNVPFSEDLVFFIRRCAGDRPGLEVRLRHMDAPSSVYEVCIVRGADDAIVESDPDVFIAVRNAFEILKARRNGALPADVAADFHG